MAKPPIKKNLPSTAGELLQKGLDALPISDESKEAMAEVAGVFKTEDIKSEQPKSEPSVPDAEEEEVKIDVPDDFTVEGVVIKRKPNVNVVSIYNKMVQDHSDYLCLDKFSYEATLLERVGVQRKHSHVMHYRTIIGEKESSDTRRTNTLAGDLRGIGAKLIPGSAFKTQKGEPRQFFVTALNKTLLRRSFGMTRSFTVEQLLTLAAMSTDLFDKLPPAVREIDALIIYVTKIIKVKKHWTYTVGNFQRILAQHGNAVLSVVASAMSNSMSMVIDPEFGCPLIVKLVLSNRYSEVIHVKRVNQATDISSVLALVSQKVTAYNILGIEIISGMFPKTLTYKKKQVIPGKKTLTYKKKQMTPGEYFTMMLRLLIDATCGDITVSEAKRNIFYGLPGHETTPISQMIPIQFYSMVSE